MSTSASSGVTWLICSPTAVVGRGREGKSQSHGHLYHIWVCWACRHHCYGLGRAKVAGTTDAGWGEQGCGTHCSITWLSMSLGVSAVFATCAAAPALSKGAGNAAAWSAEFTATAGWARVIGNTITVMDGGVLGLHMPPGFQKPLVSTACATPGTSGHGHHHHCWGPRVLYAALAASRASVGGAATRGWIVDNTAVPKA